VTALADQSTVFHHNARYTSGTEPPTLDAVMRSKSIRITCGSSSNPRKGSKGSNLIQLMMWCCFAAATSATSSADAQKPTPISTTATIRTAATANSSSCHASDFALDQLKSRHQSGHAYIVGRVVNNCDSETGVQIKIAILDHTGGILRVSNFWPASTDNIPAHSGFPFQTEIEGVDSFDRFQVSVIEVKRWTP
jgi:hypothetical protein